MMPRLSNIEKLARDICWAERTGGNRPKGMTKAAYWNAIHQDARARHIYDATWLVVIVKKLKPLRVLAMVDFK